jgi:hypothetical protein
MLPPQLPGRFVKSEAPIAPLNLTGRGRVIASAAKQSRVTGEMLVVILRSKMAILLLRLLAEDRYGRVS